MKSFSNILWIMVIISMLFPQAIFSPAKALAAQSSSNRTLDLGMQGDDVRLLQIMLNRDPSTQISVMGPGSPGQETSFFGSLTRDAVLRFQNKYAPQVLQSNGLAEATGIVGPSTWALLSTLYQDSTAVAGAVSTLAPMAKAAITPTGGNPNLENVDEFFSALDRVAAEQDISAATMVQVKEGIIKELATTTDLKKTFMDMIAKTQEKKKSNISMLDRALSTVEDVITYLFVPKSVEAGILSNPFGGRLIFSLYCTCSLEWLIVMRPLPPKYATVLTYTPFSQIYLSYTIPKVSWLLGSYYKKGVPCEMYAGFTCFVIPSQGMISPKVGSALL